MISVVIPAHNEAGRIGATVRSVASIWPTAEILVIDDASTDDTAKKADDAGASVVILPVNRGKGGAVQVGVEASRGDIIVMLDADLMESALEAEKLMEPITSGRADMTVAELLPIEGAPGGFGFVVRMAANGIRRLTGFESRAPLSGQRAIRRSVLEQAMPFSSGFGLEVGLTIDVLRSGFRVVEVPVTMTHRFTGRDWAGLLHRFRQYLEVRRALKDRQV